MHLWGQALLDERIWLTVDAPAHPESVQLGQASLWSSLYAQGQRHAGTGKGPKLFHKAGSR